MSTLDLYATVPGGTPVRTDERFHWQRSEPVPHVRRVLCIRRTSWSAITAPSSIRGTLRDALADVGPDHSPASFISWAIGWGTKRVQLYHGTSKCDGSRTYALRGGLLGGTDEQRAGYVMTTTPKEMWAFRLRDLATEPAWNNMGGF